MSFSLRAFFTLSTLYLLAVTSVTAVPFYQFENVDIEARAPGAATSIHPGLDVTKCLDLKGNVQANGTPVQTYDCNGSGAQNWIFDAGAGQAGTRIQLAGTNFCLDAGSNPADGVGMKIWTCIDSIPAQQWVFTDNDRVNLKGKNQCIDVRKGSTANGNQMQTWSCTANNPNQLWMQKADVDALPDCQ